MTQRAQLVTTTKLALLALRQSGHNVSHSALRMWLNRSHIRRGTGGHDLAENLAQLDRRN
jgi:hypothetical protein